MARLDPPFGPETPVPDVIQVLHAPAFPRAVYVIKPYLPGSEAEEQVVRGVIAVALRFEDQNAFGRGLPKSWHALVIDEHGKVAWADALPGFRRIVSD
jgi:hypothetical protein